tara:strand:- start:312 stop:1172 length:861 start_codon:yes stop_codon:yes gene_type:complete
MPVSPPVAVRRSRDVVLVAGPDSQNYLQGQLSQDVEELGLGEAAETFALQPTGKVAAWMRLSRLDEAEYLLDVDSGWGAAVVARLSRFMLRTDCKVSALPWQLVTVFDVEPDSMGSPDGGLALPVAWPGLTGLDLLGPEVAIPDNVREVEESYWDFRRVAAGIPAMGSEMDEGTIPGATGVVDRSASFTKGCYTGQELVARVDSRTAGTPTRLVRAVGSGPVPAAGAPLADGGAEVGLLTSVVAKPEDALGVESDGTFVALAFVKRGVQVPTQVHAGSTIVELRAD